MEGTPDVAESAERISNDPHLIPGATPWTHEKFTDESEECQFAVIGDRTGGANVQGTFALAMGSSTGCGRKEMLAEFMRD